MRRTLGMIAIVVVAAACAGREATPSPAATPKPGYITRAELGSAWPFKAAAGTIACQMSGGANDRPLVTFDPGDGISYALNGAAIDFGFPEPDETVMAASADPTMLLPLIDRGLRLCK